MADPASVRMPGLGISAELQPLRVDGSGRLRAPDYGIAGWYAAGPEPGEPGRAVIAGHLDSKTGPDVFWDLHRARRGDEIVVKTTDGRPVRFVVEHVGQFPRADFPTGRVYGGPRDVAELRLITCAGRYVADADGYQDNIVVFAHRV